MSIFIPFSLSVLLVMYVAQKLLFIVRRNKHQECLNDQLSEVCRLLSNSLREGMSFDRALADLEKRIPTRDFRIFAAALLIQWRAGGNLCEVLQEMAETLDDRRVDGVERHGRCKHVFQPFFQIR